MLKNKRGQFFAVLLFFLVLFMVFLAVVLYWNQQGNMQSSIISPFALLRLEDRKDIFEFREGEVVLAAVCNYESGDFESVEIYEGVINSVMLDSRLNNFLLQYVGAGDSDLEEREMIESFYRVTKEGKMVIVERRARKDFELQPIKDGKNAFPVGVEWVYEKTYEINLEDDC